MARKLDEIEAELMALPREERARLARELIVSLDEDEECSQEEIDAAWKAEIEKRHYAMLNGTAKFYDAEQVMRELKARVKINKK